MLLSISSSLAPSLGYSFPGFPVTASIPWDNTLLHFKLLAHFVFFCLACSNACSVIPQLTCNQTQFHCAEQQQEEDRVNSQPAPKPCMLYS